MTAAVALVVSSHARPHTPRALHLRINPTVDAAIKITPRLISFFPLLYKGFTFPQVVRLAQIGAMPQKARYLVRISRAYFTIRCPWFNIRDSIYVTIDKFYFKFESALRGAFFLLKIYPLLFLKKFACMFYVCLLFPPQKQRCDFATPYPYYLKHD